MYYHYTHPVTSVEFDSNRVTISNNYFEKNYAVFSNGLYIQGVMNLLMESNTFIQNSIGRSGYYEGLDFSGNAFARTNSIPYNPSGYTTSPMVESSPVIIRLGNYVTIKNNIFNSNIQGMRGGDAYFAQAITMHLMIGKDGITIDSCQFLNHQGFSGPLVNSNNGYHDFAATALITLNFYETLTGRYSSTKPGEKVVKNNATKVIIKNCIFSGNKFNYRAQSDEKKIYFDQNKITNSYLHPFAAILKYFFEAEAVTENLAIINQFQATDPMKNDYNFLEEVNIIADNNTFHSNYLGQSMCAFNTYWMNSFTISNSNF